MNQENAFPEIKNLLNERRASTLLGVCPRTLRRRRIGGALGFYRIGGRILYAPKHLADYVNNCEFNPNSEGGQAHA